MLEEIGTPIIRMEEEEEEGWAPSPPRRIGFASEVSEGNEQDTDSSVRHNRVLPAGLEDFLRSFAEERKAIHDNEKLTAKDKQRLLDENRKTLVVATGGTVRKTDSVVYGILIFGGIGMLTLALLTTFANLPSEVTLTFVGTVLGGTIATIAQKRLFSKVCTTHSCLTRLT